MGENIFVCFWAQNICLGKMHVHFSSSPVTDSLLGLSNVATFLHKFCASDAHPKKHIKMGKYMRCSENTQDQNETPMYNNFNL
jgi:hypothetical protein